MARDPDPAGDSWIWAAVQEHEAALILLATRLLGDRERARDVVQDTFLRLCGEERERVSPHLGRWLFTVCRNRALDVLRKERRMRPALHEESPPPPAVDAPPSTALEQDEAGAAVLALLVKLPERQQEVLRLRFQGGLAYREIAEVLSTSVGNVGFLLHQGLENLRAKLAGTRAEGLLP